MSKAIDAPSKKDERGPFALDARLRRFGFKIASRLDGQEPLWERDGKLFTQREAIRLVEQQLKTLASGGA